MRQRLHLRLIPLYILALVLAIPLLRYGWDLHSVQQTAQAATTRPELHQSVAGTPTRIVVPAAAIDLPVVAATQNPITHIWPVAARQANYASTTAPANNQQGQTFIYGHNNHHVFGALLELKPGDEVLVYTANNHVFRYSYSGSHDVSPTQTDIFQTMQKGTGLVLMTCDGDHFEYRHLMHFRLEGVS